MLGVTARGDKGRVGIVAGLAPELPSYAAFLDLARRRRSVRRFSDRPVPPDVVERLLAAAQEAPTSCNHQLNRYVVVDDRQLLRALHEVAGAPETVARAPVSIVLLFRMGWNHNKLSVAQSLGMAAQNILLAATSLGLAGVLQAGIGDTRAIGRILGIGDGYFIGSILSLGWSDDDLPRPPRLPTADVAGWNRFAEAPALRYLRRRRGQVWNFGPYAPLSPPRVERFLAPDLAPIARSGLSLSSRALGREFHDSRRLACGTLCYVVERR